MVYLALFRVVCKSCPAFRRTDMSDFCQMRKYFYLSVLLFCLICNRSYSQDLIVTNVGDSIACKIVRLEEKSVYYSYIKYNLSEIREISRDRVRSVIPGFYTQRDSSKSAAVMVRKDTLLQAFQAPSLSTVQRTEDSLYLKPSPWRFGINGGYAYRLFKPQISSTDYEMQYINDLKPGYSFGADLFYFPWEKVGLGLKYNVYKSKGTRDIRTKDDITIQFAGISAAHRQAFENKKASVLTAFWVGYQPYHNVKRAIGQDFVLRAATMGWGGSVGIDQKIGKNIALNISGSCFIGNVYKFRKEYRGQEEVVNLQRENFEDLSRAEITVGLKFLN
jgi:hypothetical protein